MVEPRCLQRIGARLDDGEGASGGVDELEEIEREGAGCRRNASGHGICRGCVHRGSNGDVFAG